MRKNNNIVPFHNNMKRKNKKSYEVTNEMSLYELNKQILEKTNSKPLTSLELGAIQEKIDDWFNMEIDTYAMLLCNERKDFTVFHLYENQNPNPTAIAASELIGCLTDRGEVLSIDETKDKAWEIWLKIGEKYYCYYLFKYDDAVIEC